MEVTNRYVVIKAKIDGKPQESDFEFKTETLSLPINPLSNDVIVKNLCISIDPYMINRMKTASVSQKISEFATGISPGEVIVAFGVGKVVASSNPKIEKDDYVVGHISWGEYSISQGFILNKLDPMGFPFAYHVGILGLQYVESYQSTLMLENVQHQTC